MSSRRPAHDLDRLLDRLAAGREPEATGDLAPLLHPARVARATLRRAVPATVALDHLAALRRDRARNVSVSPGFRRRGLRIGAIGLVGAIVLVLGAGSAVAATARALPGERGYGIKIAVEDMTLAMHRDPLGRAELRLRFAERRLVELQ